MHVIEIDLIDPETLQAALDAPSAVLGRRVNRDAGGSIRFEAKLGSEENIRAPLRVKLKPLPNCVFAVTVYIGGVPIGTAKLPRPIKQFEAVLVGSDFENVKTVPGIRRKALHLLGRAIANTESHKAKPGGRDPGAFFAELAGESLFLWGHIAGMLPM